MTYIENVFVCMAAPLVVALLSLKRGQRAALVFCLAGMGACLLSAYLNTFFARLYQADARQCRHPDRAGGGGDHEAAAAAVLSGSV